MSLEYELCNEIKKVQIERFIKLGFTEEEAKKLWKRYKYDYLTNWRKFIEFGLVELPKGLKKVSNREINKYLIKGE